MGRSGDVENQPVIALEPDPGAIARGPAAERGQEPRVERG